MNILHRLLDRASLRAAVVVVATSMALVMAGSVGGLRWALRRAEARSARVAHARDVITQAHALARSASNAHAAGGTFLVTHVDEARTEYRRGVDAFRRQLAGLSAAVADDARLVARVRCVGDLFEVWEQEESALLDATADVPVGRAPRGPSRAERLDDDGLRAFTAHMSRMEALQLELDDLVADQATEVRAGDSAVFELSGSIDRGASLATALVVLAAAAAVVLYSRWVAAPLAELRSSAQAIARGDLRRRVKVRREDEIGSLARSFNVMAAQLDEQQREDDLLREVRELMHAAQDVDEVARVLALLVPACLPQTTGRMFLLDAGERLVHRGGWGDAPLAKPIPASSCWAFRMGRAHEASTARRKVVCGHAPDAVRDCVCMPLGARGANLGILEVTFDGVAPRGITALAETLALTLANLRAGEEMRDEAQRDGLTGVYNRRHFERALEEQLARPRADGSAFVVALVDVDHFKHFNDAHGHAAGDAVLRELAATLSARCRGSDLVCRYGGEEFAVLLPDCGIEDGVRRAEEFRAAVGALKVLAEGQILEPATISVGVAAFPVSGTDRVALLTAADEALYRSKRDGRDRVTAAKPGRSLSVA